MRRSISFAAAVLLGGALSLAGCANTWENYARKEGVPGCSTSGRDACGGCVADTPCPERPPQARPGEAWCRVKVPAVYESVCETVTLECESCRCEWVPPVYETRVREVCIRPACAREVTMPAVSRTVEECVEVCPPRVEVQRVCCPVDPCPDPCAPKQEECFAQVQIPAQTQKVCREVCVSPAASKMVYEPPLYETVVENCVVKPGYWRSIPVPAVHDRVCHQVCVCPERWEWRRNDVCVVPAPCAPSPCVPPAAPLMFTYRPGVEPASVTPDTVRRLPPAPTAPPAAVVVEPAPEAPAPTPDAPAPVR